MNEPSFTQFVKCQTTDCSNKVGFVREIGYTDSSSCYTCCWKKLKKDQQTIKDFREALEKAYKELNIIRARDGVPYCYDGIKSDVDPAYFSSVVDEAKEVLSKHPEEQ